MDAGEQEVDELRKRIAELQSFLRSASHDLRTPLMTVRGFNEELAISTRELQDLLADCQTTFDSDRIRAIVEREIPEAIQFIGEGAAKLEALINDLTKGS